MSRESVTIEYRWAQGDYNRLPALVADLIQRKAHVILTGATLVTRAAKAASTTVPIVFADRRRSHQGWTCRQPQSTRRERYRRKFLGQ